MRRSRWSPWLVVALASCDNQPFVGYVSRSQFFEYHDQVQEPLCPTLLSSLDDHAQMIGNKVGLTLDTNRPFRYYKFRDGAAFAAHSGGCPPENGACALGDAIYATTFFHAHEQAHDYVFRAWGGWSNGLLSEGEAVALSCNPFHELEPGQRPIDVLGPQDWRNLLNLFGDSNEGYGAAGFFVTYLAARYGWQSVAALHRKVSRGASAGDFERAFAEAYPTTSIDQEWANALGAAGAPPCQRDWRCMTTPMAVGEVAAPDCDGEMHRSVDVGALGGVVLSMKGDNSRLMLLPCADATPTSYVLEAGPVGRPTTHWASMPPGSYALFPGPLPASVALRSSFQGSLVGGACDSAPAVALDADGRTSVDLLPGGLTGWIHLAGGSRMYEVYSYNLVWNDVLTAGPVSICDDCSMSAPCVPLPYGLVTRVLVSDQSVVRFQGAIADPPPAAWGQLVFDIAPANGP